MSFFALSWFLPLSPTILLPWVSMLGRGVPLPNPPPQLGGECEATV